MDVSSSVVKKCTSLDSGEALLVSGQRVYRKSVPPAQLCCELKTSLKK